MARPSILSVRTVMSGLLLIATILIATLGMFMMARNPQPVLPAAPVIPQTQVLPTLTPLEEVSTLLLRRELGIWEYRALRNNMTGLKAVIDYKHDTPDDIQSYVLANKALITDVIQAGGRAEVAISFLPPLAPDHFRTWALQRGLQVKQAQLAVGAPGSSGGTLMISGTPDDPLPLQSVGKFPYSGMGGVFGVYGNIDSGQLNSVANDPQVFLLDVTPAWARLDLLRAGILDAQQASVYLSLPYGYMEQLDMVPTPIAIPSPIGTVQPLQLPIAPDSP